MKGHEGKPWNAKSCSHSKSVKIEKLSRGSGHFPSMGPQPGRRTHPAVTTWWRHATPPATEPALRKEKRIRKEKDKYTQIYVHAHTGTLALIILQIRRCLPPFSSPRHCFYRKVFPPPCPQLPLHR